MRILHLGNEKSWRGGENQIFQLIGGLKSEYFVENWLAYPQTSPALERFSHLCPVLPLPSANPYDPRSVLRLSHWIKTNQIHIIDAHSSGAHTLALLVKKICPAVKLVVHRRVDNPLKNRFFTKKKYLNQQVDRFVAISYFIGHLLEEFGVSKNKITVVRSAVNSQAYSQINRQNNHQLWTQKLGLNMDTLLVGSVAALSLQKGPDIFLQSIAEFKKYSPQTKIHFILAGTGTLEKPLRKLAKNLKIESNISFVGFIKEVPELISALDIMVLPSRNEGLGTVILDAMWAETPVIATQVGGIPEMVEDNKTGLLVPNENPQALAKALSHLLSSPQKQKILVEEAKKRIQQEFSLSSMIRGNWGVYESLMQSSSPLD